LSSYQISTVSGSDLASIWTEREQGGKLADIYQMWIIAYSSQMHKKAWQIGYAINQICLKNML